MSTTFQIVMNVSRDFLRISTSATGSIDESDIEFAEVVCETMVSLGLNLQCISGNGIILPLYLQQALMRELVYTLEVTHPAYADISDNSIPCSVHVYKDKKVLSFLQVEVWGVILNVSFQLLINKEHVSPEAALSLGMLE
ncbi:Hasty-like protein [Thalictrum thalictroides]|uniref:Hasty-like protein n=1 Tax=Thalictrum thalictroides TaxID=46969 RepID=A0A7J6V9X4_THATH|nr:Hasty-like protein [Thalictrum thalictroides]